MPNLCVARRDEKTVRERAFSSVEIRIVIGGQMSIGADLLTMIDCEAYLTPKKKPGG